VRWSLAAFALSLVGAALVIAPVVLSPSDTIVCGWVHPDCLGNHWLLEWVADRLLHGQSLVHNDRYYWPIGDAPWLAGNGSDGFLYLPWHVLLGWPRASTAHTLTILTLNGVGAWSLARAAGASPAAALAAAPTAAMSVYAGFELGAGRFSQADMGFLALFLASWLRLLDAPGPRRAFVAAALLAATSALYWYYGLFAVVAGAVLLLFRGRAALTGPTLRALALFAPSFLVLIAPLLAIFLLNWSAIPGTGEATQFPHPEALGDSCWPAIPFLVQSGRHAGRALPFTTTVLALVTLWFRRDRLTLGLAAVGVLFAALMAGPLLPHGPYEWLYGLAAPLRRFWWPYRHVVVLNFVWITLASLALDHLLSGRRRATAGVVLALSIPLQLELLRAPYHALFSKAVVPVPFYEEVGELPGSILLEPPLTPDVAVSQAPLIYQLDHKKTLVGGHALWVQRVRPAGWDAATDGNSFLAACRDLERARLTGVFRFEAADLDALRDAGLRTVSLNRELFPARLYDVTNAYEAVFRALFGDPAVGGPRALAWDLDRWSGRTEVPLAPFSWPSGLGRGGPTLPVQSHLPPSLAFSLPAPPK
jgi:hypothetical protein